jgi:hypothetical protein
MNKYDIANILVKLLGLSNCLGVIRILGNSIIPITAMLENRSSQTDFGKPIITLIVHIILGLGIGIPLIVKSEYIVSRIFRIQDEKN